MATTSTPNTAPRTRKPLVKRGVGAHTYSVESQSTRGVFYTISLHGAPRCSCPAGKHGRLCWHVPAAQAYARAYAAMLAQAPTLPSSATSTPQAPFHESAGYRALAEAFAA